MKSKKDVQRRQTMKTNKDAYSKELKREAEALTQAVGYEGEVKSKAAEVIILNNKATVVSGGMSKKEKLEQQEELKSKVNKLFDMRASDPLIINRLKRVSTKFLPTLLQNDSVLNNVKVNENYFNNPQAAS